MVVYELPLNEVVFDFYDRLKSVTRGYASFDYQMTGYEQGDLVRMQVLVNEEPVDALAVIVHRGRAEQRGRTMCEKLKELIPRHMFKIPIQAAIGGKCHRARNPFRVAQGRDRQVLWRRHPRENASCWTSRRRARRRCASSASVEIPQEAFIAALKMDEN
jgi:GTP-binding protein LepA